MEQLGIDDRRYICRELFRQLTARAETSSSPRVLVYILSLKWITLIVVDPEPARTLLIRVEGGQSDVPYIVHYSSGDRNEDSRAEVLHREGGLLLFKENGESATVTEFANKLIHLVAGDVPT